MGAKLRSLLLANEAKFSHNTSQCVHMSLLQGVGVRGSLHHEHICASVGEQGSKGTLPIGQLCNQLPLPFQVHTAKQLA
ncbi:hypothetical protein DPMN_035271 [Dreissena polymorpha]|uniref:Uncharacterized protein n=1 Tax=Dreissena polymorpha TaxID=45954 RepID=A0A9D4M8W9_DREPO|nr:hypothetical protein DPMN_035271 [Dreissena polymorpha]